MNQENLWAPWRMAYLRDLKRKADEIGGWDSVTGGNFLIDYWQQPERDVVNHVVHRDESGIVLLNRYPYANGHLLVALGDARPRLNDYDHSQRAALWVLIEFAWELMQFTLHPQGINMGINEGRAAGAGVPEHLHAHLVPRWAGDTNFLPVVGQVRIIPDSLEAMADAYRTAAAQMTR